MLIKKLVGTLSELRFISRTSEVKIQWELIGWYYSSICGYEIILHNFVNYSNYSNYCKIAYGISPSIEYMWLCWVWCSLQSRPLTWTSSIIATQWYICIRRREAWLKECWACVLIISCTLHVRYCNRIPIKKSCICIYYWRSEIWEHMDTNCGIWYNWQVQFNLTQSVSYSLVTLKCCSVCRELLYRELIIKAFIANGWQVWPGT